MTRDAEAADRCGGTAVAATAKQRPTDSPLGADTPSRVGPSPDGRSA
ncbi:MULTISPECIES: hypothetical protein [Halorubrum]|nr:MULTISPECIES: hypothetical protein [Halorubrum]